MKSLLVALWQKLLFWKKPMTENVYLEGVDYTFIPIQDSDLLAIKILKGEFENVTYCYGGVGVVEEGEGARLKFDYIVIDSGRYTVEDLTENENFSTMLGDILVEMISVEGHNDSPRNNNSEEPDLF